ncbi:MAG: hypothetical protein QF415_15440 [Candidatus Undinarchaeales archaeon]|jgi:hypothetical protein|nr:hypothetical protein [Candidatus Undinarchaeales archaeon]MDP7493965.1 hypothetical protein [Candidatus Undinarchaeales archaeon]
MASGNSEVDDFMASLGISTEELDQLQIKTDDGWESASSYDPKRWQDKQATRTDPAHGQYDTKNSASYSSLKAMEMDERLDMYSGINVGGNHLIHVTTDEGVEGILRDGYMKAGGAQKYASERGSRTGRPIGRGIYTLDTHDDPSLDQILTPNFLGFAFEKFHNEGLRVLRIPKYNPTSGANLRYDLPSRPDPGEHGYAIIQQQQLPYDKVETLAFNGAGKLEWAPISEIAGGGYSL